MNKKILEILSVLSESLLIIAICQVMMCTMICFNTCNKDASIDGTIIDEVIKKAESTKYINRQEKTNDEHKKP